MVSSKLYKPFLDQVCLCCALSIFFLGMLVNLDISHSKIENVVLELTISHIWYVGIFLFAVTVFILQKMDLWKNLIRFIIKPYYSFFDTGIISFFVSFILYTRVVQMESLKGIFCSFGDFIGSIMAFYMVWVIYRLYCNDKKYENIVAKDTDLQPLYSDQPISEVENDKFKRWPFAQQMGQIIERIGDKGNLVIGLYGKWGTGKTSTLNFIKEYFKSKSDTFIVLDFNPWFFGSEKEVIRQFFLELSAKFKEPESNELAKTLIKYSERISSIRLNLGIAAFSLENILGVDHDIYTLREDIESSLHKLGKRVIIFVDDVDRLDSKETCTMFKLVKLIAGFPNISYILAFDDEIAINALDNHYQDKGKDFLEKIIQIPLNLPPVDINILKEYMLTNILDIIKKAGLYLSAKDTEEIVSIWDVSIGQLISTPREAKRYLNVLMFSLPLLVEEVHVIDQVFIEALRVFFPKIFDFVRGNPQYALVSPSGICIDQKDFNEKGKDQFEELFKDNSMKERQIIKTIIQELFPRTKAYWANTEVQWRESWGKEKRICSLEYFHRYFRYTVPAGDIPDALVQEFCKMLEDQKKYSEKIRGIIESNSSSLIPKLRWLKDSLTAEESRKIIILLASNGKYFAKNDSKFSTWGKAIMLISELIGGLSDNRAAFAKSVIGIAHPLNVAWNVFRHIGSDEKLEQQLFTNEEITDIAKILVDRIMEEKSNNNFFEIYAGEITLPLWICNKWGNQEQLHSAIRNWISGFNGVENLLLEYFPNSFDWERNYKILSEVFPPTEVEKAIKDKYGDLIVPEDSIGYMGCDRHMVSIYRFLQVHRAVKPN